ncbi:Putative_serine esterase [Hexamita inflata]|uniref:Serine esterase n=1 Tax=Hexamita inflata TaxID=28002 RepID=A0AA86PCS3_9EUKA|nr:Putative serine esterase [Hexamita inflata]
MKVDIHLFLRHLSNVDVLQRGWNYITFKFIGQSPLSVKLVKTNSLLYDLIERKDPKRFFDQKTEFNYDPESQMFTTQAFRIEYFDQLIQFNKSLSFELETDEQSILFESTVHFKHYPKLLPEKAPPISQCETTFQKFWVMQRIDLPAIQPIIETFNEMHLCQFEMVFVWKQQNNQHSKYFEAIYGDEFENALQAMSSSKNLKKLLQQNVQQFSQQTVQRIIPIENTNTNTVTEAVQLIRMLNQETLHTEIYQDNFVTQSVIQIKKEEKEENLFSPNEEVEVISGEDVQNADELAVKEKIQKENTINAILQIRQNTFAARRQHIINKNTIHEPVIFQVQSSTQSDVDYELLLKEANASTKRYNATQLKFLTRNNDQVIKDARITKQYCALKRQSELDVYVMVHGYKGSYNDHRYIKDMLQIQYDILDKPVKFIMLDYSQAQNTNLLELGYQLNTDLKRRLINEFGAKSWEGTLDKIGRLNFIGFSMGNVVIESMMSLQTYDADQVQFYEAFTNQYNQVQQEYKDQLLNNQFKPVSSLLSKLNLFISVNGPLLGATATNSLVDVGMGFIKAFGKKSTNQCVRELENQPMPRESLESFRFRVPSVQEIMQFDALEEMQVSGMCVQQLQTTINQNGFKAIHPLDLIGFESKLSFFRKIIVFGSYGDGYVNQNSACVKQTKADQIYALYGFKGCTVQRYLIYNEPDRFVGGKIDVKSGRLVHLCPLIDTETVEAIVGMVIAEV